MNIVNRNKTIAVILGATGTGKSKLAIEIAKKYNGEVINADSMQIYKGLDIVTNKVSKEECLSVPHHMIGFQDPLKVYNVVDYRNDVLPHIERIHSDGKLPVIVGGTHYYIEAILWKVLVQSENFDFIDNNQRKKVDILKRMNIIKNFVKDNISDKSVDNFLKGFIASIDIKCTAKNEEKIHCEVECSCSISSISEDLKQLLKLIKNDDLLKLLEDIDPEMACIYHPNDTRKIIRSIEVWIQTGVCHSKHIQRQSQEAGDVDLGGSIRFNNTALLWITCNQEILDKRLDDRVDVMIKQGLLKELSEFWSLYHPVISKSEDLLVEDHHKQGIFQCIGFKEFYDYLKFDEEKGLSQNNSNTYNKAVELMKLRTRQYSRRQLKWIKNRFLMRNRMRIPVFSVDGTNLELWDRNVSVVADEVMESILSGKKPTTSPVEIQSSDNITLYLGNKTRHYCDVCNRVLIGTPQWNSHIKGQKHRKMLKRDCPKDKNFQKIQKVL